MNDAHSREAAIFDAALQLPPEQHGAYLDESCADDAALRERIEALLKACDATGEFLNAPAAPALVNRNVVLLTEKPGDWIGRYKLLQQIGEGGCGVVYMAEQEEPVRRRVALKVIKLGMDTKIVIARFEAERQALAMMDHPNIAKVLDAGATETGRPYFVMELVRGIRITDYCDQLKLPTRERLSLFISVCQAVQHAHQKGIIHRDLKPSNILVTEHDGAAVPKIIDFGIAKATTDQRLTDKTLFTAFEQFIGTPAYTSPEQAGLGGLDIDTRSDIYSLGVLLYELLTGRAPFGPAEFQRSAIDEILRVIWENEPPRPSIRITTLNERELTTVAQQRQVESVKLLTILRGDLDWIVMKCLEKDRTRRYETANGLAADLQRHLNNEPVFACPPTATYRFRKLVRRNKLVIATTSAVLAALVIGLGTAIGMFLKERKASRQAMASERRAQSETAKSGREAERARHAESEAKENLWKSYLSQARALRWSGRAGQRIESLSVLRQAAEIRPALELRNEAITCMALPDLRVYRKWEDGVEGETWAFDAKCERYVRVSPSKKSIQVCRVEGDVELMSATGCEAPILGATFSPNGQYLAVACGETDSLLRVWDLDRKEVVFQPANCLFRTMTFSADSRHLAVAERNGRPTVIYDLAIGKPLRTMASTPLVWGISFHPTGRSLAVSSTDDNLVRILDVETGQVIHSLSHPAPTREIDWHPDGNSLAVACQDHLVYVWDMATGVAKTLASHQGAVLQVRFDTQGEFLASNGEDGLMIFWDTFTGRRLLSRPIASFHNFSLDGRLMWGWFDSERPALLEVERGYELRTLRGNAVSGPGPSALDYSPDGQLLATGHRDGVRLWNVTAGRQLEFLATERVQSICFNRRGDQLLIGGAAGLKSWPMAVTWKGAECQLKFDTPQTVDSHPLRRKVYLTPDGRTLAYIRGQQFRVLDAENFSEKTVSEAHPNLFTIALSPDAKWAATGTWIGSGATVWDVRTGKPIRHLIDPPSQATETAMVDFSPDNRWLVAGFHWEYRVWEVGTWKLIRTIRRNNANQFLGPVAFSSDGRMMACADGPGQFRLIDPATGGELATLQTPTPQIVWWTKFNRDNKHLALASREYDLTQQWDLGLIRQQLAAMNLDWDLPPYQAYSNGENREKPRADAANSRP